MISKGREIFLPKVFCIARIRLKSSFRMWYTQLSLDSCDIQIFIIPKCLFNIGDGWHNMALLLSKPKLHSYWYNNMYIIM